MTSLDVPDTLRLGAFLRRLGTSLLSWLVALMRIVRSLLLSARAWVLFVLSIIAALVLYYVLADRHTPFTTDAYVQAYVVQVAARVEGQVVGVFVQENQAVRKDELLFEIDPRPFEYRVALLEAKRVDAVQQVAQMDSELSAAKAEDARLVAEEAYARTVYEEESAIYKQKATTDRKYVDAVQRYNAAQAARQRGVAQTHKVEQALAARIGEEHALVAAVQAQLEEARLNLEWTHIYAPANGYVTNVQLRVGAYAHVGMPVITFIDGDQWWVVANYRENSLENLRAGQSVGLTFNTYPGRIFHGVVQTVGWGVDEGQGLPSGNLPAIQGPRTGFGSPAQRFRYGSLHSCRTDIRSGRCDERAPPCTRRMATG